MITQCSHMLERTIEHWPTGSEDFSSVHVTRNYRPGDMLTFLCPHGCDPIIVFIKENKEEEACAPR